jgi:large subunit ribosomal protein L18
MSTFKTKRRQRIKWSIRRKVNGTSERPRLSVFRSNKDIYAQLIDDVSGHTLASVSAKNLGLAGLLKILRK